jgi:hypothetical protein
MGELSTLRMQVRLPCTRIEPNLIVSQFDRLGAEGKGRRLGDDRLGKA